MARKHRGKPGRHASHRPLNRSATRRPPSRDHAGPPSDDPRDQPLIQSLRTALREDPLGFILSVSMLVTAIEAGPEDLAPRPGSERPPAGQGVTLVELTESFLDTDIAETTAALHVLAALTGDDLQAARIRRELPRRRQPVPAMVRHLAEVRTRSVAFLHDELGDGENVFFDLVWPDGSVATVLVYIDHAAGTRVKDAFAVSEPIDTILDRYHELMEAEGRDETELGPMDPADARATVEHALAGVRYVDGDSQETWPGARPFVEMLVRSLPTRGTRYAGPPAYRPLAPADALREFLASPEADVLAGGAAQEEAAQLLLRHAAEQFGHPLRWSARTVEAALTEQLPFAAAVPDVVLEAVPGVLGPLVRYSHRVTGASRPVHEDAMHAVDLYTDEFFDLCEGGAASPELAEDLLALFDGDPGPLLRRHAADVVGGEDVLANLDDDPLPDEPLALDEVPADIREAVGEVGGWIDRWFAESPEADRLGPVGAELRTACRRFLARAAAGDPQVFRRRARADIGADAVIWTVGRANGLVGVPPAVVAAQDLHRWFGTGAPTTRAESLRRAYGVPQGSDRALLGDASLLTGAFRAGLIDRLEDFAQ
ncbi:MAG TPA: hypothetical protein VFL99_09275 [Segeticoccus sp.]|uniref:hypothetical protein n=1 Tax=Segeticoccus sp. TaxID=2706531 RepID=UPI002D80A229|nr:hypothetical protein [Segeticoccus sp.]HET8600505.1 hypothetical protein [Segeticoccus sp.]